MNRNVSVVLRMVPMALVMGTIFFLSHQPGDSLPLPSLPGLDKLAHMSIYGILAGTVLFAFSDHQKNARTRKVILLTVIFCFFYGISDEVHQSFVPGRTASVYDLLADGVGAAIVCALWVRWRKRMTVLRFL